MNKTIEQTVTTDETNVCRLAYELWENAGRPSGRDLEFWLAAEAKVRTGGRPASSETAVRNQPVRAQEKAPKALRLAGNGTKKTWPKPYPNLPKF
jgi:hypothetical protein